MAHMVMCRVCRQRFDTEKGKEGEDWIMPSRNFYYHKRCYNNWKNAKEHSQEEWIELIFDLIARDLKGEYNYQMILAQIKKQINNRMTPKGIYFSLYWYFIIKKNKWQSEYGIGIVPHIYAEATRYWINQERKQSGIVKQIEDLAKGKKKESLQVSKPRQVKRKQIKAPGD